MTLKRPMKKFLRCLQFINPQCPQCQIIISYPFISIQAPVTTMFASDSGRHTFHPKDIS